MQQRRPPHKPLPQPTLPGNSTLMANSVVLQAQQAYNDDPSTASQDALTSAEAAQSAAAAISDSANKTADDASAASQNAQNDALPLSLPL